MPSPCEARRGDGGASPIAIHMRGLHRRPCCAWKCLQIQRELSTGSNNRILRRYTYGGFSLCIHSARASLKNDTCQKGLDTLPFPNTHTLCVLVYLADRITHLRTAVGKPRWGSCPRPWLGLCPRPRRATALDPGGLLVLRTRSLQLSS